MMKTLPTITIITVVRNAKELLANTLRSVKAQTYPCIQYVVIDGGSDDGTIDIIKDNLDIVDYWVSEPDEGIYHAMNKGIYAARGDYLWFMNAGDEIYSPETTDNLISTAEWPDVYYGETMLVDASGDELGTRSDLGRNKLPEALSWTDMERGMVVCHQSILVKRSIAPIYDTDHPYTADIDWIIKCLKLSSSIVNTGMVLSRFLVGGYSKRNHLRAMLDRYRVYRVHFGFTRNIINHAVIVWEVLYRAVTGKSIT